MKKSWKKMNSANLKIPDVFRCLLNFVMILIRIFDRQEVQDLRAVSGCGHVGL